MLSANGHGLKHAVLYARVSGEEQAKKGYSLADQLDALRDWCSANDYEVIDEVQDRGFSGAYLERPGLDRIREMVAGGMWTRWWYSSAIASPGAFTRSFSRKSSATMGRASSPLTVGATTRPTGSLATTSWTLSRLGSARRSPRG